jgi:CheY-like chemotaxis protein
MAELGKLLEGIATLFWPFVAVLIILRFSRDVGGVIASAKERKFALKVGGQEVTMEEVGKQERLLITDLQAQVEQIRKVVASNIGQPLEPAVVGTVLSSRARRSILWADDNPRNNAYLIAQLDDWGVEVDLALSTEDALRRLRGKKYDLLISDMGREEDGTYNPRAGLNLIERVKAVNKSIPIVIYADYEKVIQYGQEARDLGATSTTYSPTAVGMIIRRELGISRT